ncbi:heme ABC transporter ATP-binding protein [Acidovorax sp. NCPPB 4044]|uniref:heme ABC transporter ATP-binding protein n=1 Tax=Acidovorax sp. NCPPB 4044 TaxID=2940490 RepID=UPI002304C7D4|nr:heme ABC transporter ATP-binding protein [Acidovorax sp. NCPPB 4044]MDA8519902.1 heme ABC transporter ATP-binding protein [Acidovorax sp. NCPPB 4044]
MSPDIAGGDSDSGVLACERAAVGARGRAPLAVVTAAFRPGRVAAIVGPNGAGKSTLLSMLAGERPPLAGRIALDGRPLPRWRADALALRRAVMPQESAVAFDFTVREVVEMGRYPHRRAPGAHGPAIVDAALQATGVAHLAGRGVASLSGGERARTHLARSLAQLWEPRPGGAARWLLLDEPTAALDLAHQHQAMQLLRRWAHGAGVGVIAVLHDLNLALRYADDALLIGGPDGPGDVAWGAAAQVLTPAAVERVWGMRCEVARGADGVAQYLFGAPR